MNKIFKILFLFIIGTTMHAHACFGEDLPYNFEDTLSIPIEMNIIKTISTHEGVLEGQEVYLRVKKNVYHNGQTIVKANQLAKARVGNVITAGMNGFAAEIFLEDFEIENIKNSQLLDSYNKRGQNRALWVYPLKWALTPIPLVGSTTNFIKGGHATIKPSDTITIYYYPNWK